MDRADERWRIAAARRLLYRHGCDSGIAGHVSVRADDDSFWITPFEYFDETRPASAVRIGFDLAVREGAAVASPAVQFHAAIFAARPDVGSVVHTHSFHACVLSSLGVPLGMYHAAATIFHERQVVFRDDGILPSVHGPAVVEALGDRGLLIAMNHGIIVAADTLEHATVEAITFEQQAQLHLACVAAGGQEMHDAEVRQAKADYDRYYRAATWEAMMRRLPATDPDLFDALDRVG